MFRERELSRRGHENGSWTVASRHKRDGLNFVYMDTHGEFLGYNRDLDWEQTSNGRFLPVNPTFHP